MRRTSAQVLGLLVLGAVLTGCADDSAPGPPAPSSAPAAPAAPVVTASSVPTPPAERADPVAPVPAFPRDARRQARLTRGGGDLVLTDVRAVARPRFDRVVMEFRGEDTPGWQVRYVDQAVLDPSGREVDLAGDAILSVFASRTTWPAPGYYTGPDRFVPEQAGDIAEVLVQGTFEGLTGALLGMDGDRAPFRVFTRDDPPRLVVDVQRDR